MECVFRGSHTLFEKLAEASEGFDTAFRQLGPNEGKGPHQIEQLATDRMLITRVRLASRFHQMGSSPRGCRTFSLLAAGSPGSPGFRWCGESVNSNSLFVMPEGGEFESFSLPGFELLNLSLSNTLLEQVSQQRYGRSLGEMLGSERLLCPHGGEAVVLLRKWLQELSLRIGAGGTIYPDLDMEETLASLALSCFQPDGVKSPRGPRSKRMRALAGALELLKPADPGRLGVEELAYRTGVSRRTLEYAFRDGLGVSPSAYLKAWRLQALNRDLLRADPAEVSVAELVCPRGFVHQGQLAADYRNLFGELPSETLRRHRA